MAYSYKVPKGVGLPDLLLTTPARCCDISTKLNAGWCFLEIKDQGYKLDRLLEIVKLFWRCSRFIRI